MSLHLQANTTNIHKLNILPRSDCHLHQTVDLAECRINTSHLQKLLNTVTLLKHQLKYYFLSARTTQQCMPWRCIPYPVTHIDYMPMYVITITVHAVTLHTLSCNPRSLMPMFVITITVHAVIPYYVTHVHYMPMYVITRCWQRQLGATLWKDWVWRVFSYLSVSQTLMK